ncbi:MAG: polymer-forming cytoskeletal protein [Verrucomicrobiota bacterium]|nr:polymer-forming cytoskeletal protein [Verrucomicrobiota bacterium]
MFNRNPPEKPAATIAPAEIKEEIKPVKNMAEVNATKNILSNDVEIKGSIKFQNELIIDGRVEGEINSPGVLTVGENAEIRGEIKTKSVTVLGKVHGNITVDERCELKTRAQLIGDLKAARLTIEEGATFVGKSEVTPNKVAMKHPEIVRAPEAPKAVAGGR